jgi:hypothetical protein
MNKMGF